MPKRKNPEGDAAGGGGPSNHHGGGGGRGGEYNSGHGNYQGHGNWGNTPNYPMPHPNYNQNPPMGQGYNKYQFEPNLAWQAGKVLVRGSRTTATPVVLFEPIRKRLVVPEHGGFADDAISLPDAEDNKESNTQALARNTAAPNAQVAAQIEPGVCGTCKMPGHEVIQCWQIGPDGFTHGCGVCNSGAHETDQCQHFPEDLRQNLEILAKRRACLPPLRTAFWYNMMWKWVKRNPSTDVNHLFLWTTQFAIDVLNGDHNSEVEETLVTMRNNPDMERPLFLIDPATANWEKVKGTYGGDPKNFFEKLRAAKGAV